MRNLSRDFLLTVGQLLLWTPHLSGQAVLTGTVREDSTHRPLAGVDVILLGTARQTTTNSEGRYTLPDLPTGSHVVLFRSIGHHPVWHRVILSGSRTNTADATLIPSIVELEPLEVTGRIRAPRGIGLEAFEDRRRRGFGRFIDSTTLRQKEHLRLSSVLQQAGVEVKREQALGRRGCKLPIFLDGVLFKFDSPALNFFDVSGLAAVEVYRSGPQVPGEYAGLGTSCGAIFLWTRTGL